MLNFRQSSDILQVHHILLFPNPSGIHLIVSNNVSFKIRGNFTVVKMKGQSGKCTSLLFYGFEASFNQKDALYKDLFGNLRFTYLFTLFTGILRIEKGTQE